MMRVNSNSSTCNYPQPAGLSDWLKKIGLHQYSDVFTRNGYLYLHELQGINADSLSQLGLSNPKHRKKLLGSLNSSLKNEYFPTTGNNKETIISNSLPMGTLERGEAKTTAINPVHSII